ncbi:4-alpha-glucanotransferase [Desulfocurvus sp. DL9XJH121]
MIAALARRSSGLLMHVSSLPSRYGVGDMGSGARRFVNFLARAGQRFWQILPLNPTSPFLGNSPYSSHSLFAGNPLFISPERLAADGWLRLADIQRGLPPGGRGVDFEAAEAYKRGLLAMAWERGRERLADHEGFAAFRAEHDAAWLDDFACFSVLKERFCGAAWDTWPEEFRRREPGAMERLRRDEAEGLERARFTQYLFFSQWADVKAYANGRGISLIGDLPFYPTFDSADVWAHPGAFQLDGEGRALVVAGVPPDYFSETGQRWGNPVYDWEAQAGDGYSWWVSRIAQNLLWADLIRLDHFRGFAAYWVVPPHEDTAMNGWWVPGPGRAFFDAVRARFPELPVIAEDLGLITDDVVELREGCGLPGMRVLQFSFGPDVGESANSLHNHEPHSVAYPGTHDNNTAAGWYARDLGDEGRRRLNDYLGRDVTPRDAAWTLMRLALVSCSRLAVIPMQDVLGLGGEARMNVPSLAKGNWSWQCGPEDLRPALADRLRRLCALYGRV